MQVVTVGLTPKSSAVSLGARGITYSVSFYPTCQITSKFVERFRYTNVTDERQIDHTIRINV